MNLKHTFERFLSRFVRVLNREQWLLIGACVFGTLLQPQSFVLMVMLTIGYLGFREIYPNLERASWGELTLLFMPISLFYIMTLLCLSYGYLHTLHIPTGIDMSGKASITWAVANLDLWFRNGAAIAKLFSKPFSNIRLAKACDIVAIFAFIGWQWFLIWQSGRALVKKVWGTYQAN